MFSQDVLKLFFEILSLFDKISFFCSSEKLNLAHNDLFNEDFELRLTSQIQLQNHATVKIMKIFASEFRKYFIAPHIRFQTFLHQIILSPCCRIQLPCSPISPNLTCHITGQYNKLCFIIFYRHGPLGRDVPSAISLSTSTPCK